MLNNNINLEEGFGVRDGLLYRIFFFNGMIYQDFFFKFLNKGDVVLDLI